MTLLWRTRQLRNKAIAHKVKSRTHLYSLITFTEDTVICFNPGIHNLSQNSALGLIHLINGYVCGSQGIVHFPVIPSNHIFIFTHGLDNCLPLPLYVVYKQTEAKLLALSYTFHGKCLTSFVPEIKLTNGTRCHRPEALWRQKYGSWLLHQTRWQIRIWVIFFESSWGKVPFDWGVELCVFCFM